MKVCIITLGCKVNQYESDALANSLEKLGYEVCSKLEEADFFVVNTCAVTNEAEKKSRQTIAKIKKVSPKAKIYVCGCASEHNANKFAEIEGVKFISGVSNKLKIIQHIEKTSRKKIEVDKIGEEYEDNLIAKKTKTRAYVKIQDGCNNFCSYCLIPYLRGRSRSRNIISIMNEIDALKDDVKEVVLTGIDISTYKIDGKPALHELLNLLADYPLRIRLGSLEQASVSDEFLIAAEEMKNLCPHFHLSLQSGSNSVLKRMNRHYTTKQFEQTVKKLRKIYRDPAITTDIIVGFPGETEKEFKQTLKFAKKIGFSQIHIFPYSLREGTVAAKMPQVDGKIKRERVLKLEQLNEKLKEKYINKCRKGYHSVLIEEKVDDFFVGHSENYIKCYITAENLLPNTFVNVKIVKKFRDGAIAVPCEV